MTLSLNHQQRLFPDFQSGSSMDCWTSDLGSWLKNASKHFAGVPALVPGLCLVFQASHPTPALSLDSSGLQLACRMVS